MQFYDIIESWKGGNPASGFLIVESEEKKMCKYKIYTHDKDGKTKIMYIYYNVTIKEIIEYIKKEFVGKMFGETYVCKLNYNSGREGKKHKIF